MRSPEQEGTRGRETSSAVADTNRRGTCLRQAGAGETPLDRLKTCRRHKMRGSKSAQAESLCYLEGAGAGYIVSRLTACGTQSKRPDSVPEIFQ